MKKLTLAQLEYGKVFTIGETPSYPKLRIPGGYLDMRDEIIVKKEEIPFDIREMSDTEIATQFQMTEEDTIDWRLGLSTKYIK